MDIDHTPIRAMEPVITDRLRLAFPRNPFTIERVPLTLTNTEFKRVSRMTPFIGLAWAGFAPDGQNARVTKGDMQWRLYLIVRASNGLEARFKGDKKDIGLDAMVDVSTVLLNGATFPGIGSCHVTRVAALHADGFADDDIALAQLEFVVKFSATPGILKLIEPADFETFGITWALAGQPEGSTDITDELEPSQED